MAGDILILSYIQQHRATILINEIISQRNHFGTRLIVKPSFANIIVWKTLYESDNIIILMQLDLHQIVNLYQGLKQKN